MSNYDPYAFFGERINRRQECLRHLPADGIVGVNGAGAEGVFRVSNLTNDIVVRVGTGQAFVGGTGEGLGADLTHEGVVAVGGRASVGVGTGDGQSSKGD